MRRIWLSLLFFAATAHAQPVAITHVTVIDGNGGPPQSDMTVLVDDQKILRVDHSRTPRGATVVDGRGKFLIPGLWDMHVHLSWTTSSALPVLVATGVTGVRDLGSRLSEIDDWRSKINAGLLVGPRIVRVGPILNGQKFNQYQMVPGNPDETRGVARALKEVGVDFLKVHRRMERESYFALIDEAKKLGIPVVGHIPITVTPEEASNAGQQSIEHVATLFEGTFSAAAKGPLPEAMRAFRQSDAETLFATFVKNKTAFDPTMIAYWGIAASLDPSTPPDPRMRYVAASNKKAAERKSVTAEELAEYKATLEEYREVVRLSHKAGVTLVTGSDIAVDRIPGFTLHEELVLLVEAGLTPMEALQAATKNSADVARQSDLGTIEAGKIANLVLLSANPLDDIHNTQKIDSVILSGKLFRSADLDHLLKEAEALAARN